MTPDDLKSWRSRLGLSLTQAGDVLGITRRAYMRYEAGDREISETVARLARYVEATANERRALDEWRAARDREAACLAAIPTAVTGSEGPEDPFADAARETEAAWAKFEAAAAVVANLD